MLKKPLILPEGFPFILATMALACFFFWMKWYYLAVIPLVISVYFTYFFRCPPRNGKIPPGDDVLVSPADGTVVDVSDDVYEYTYLGEKCHKITIFLSIFDVHCNRSPMAGEIKYQSYVQGRFIPAYKDGVGFENERRDRHRRTRPLHPGHSDRGYPCPQGRYLEEPGRYPEKRRIVRDDQVRLMHRIIHTGRV